MASTNEENGAPCGTATADVHGRHFTSNVHVLTTDGNGDLIPSELKTNPGLGKKRDGHKVRPRCLLHLQLGSHRWVRSWRVAMKSVRPHCTRFDVCTRTVSLAAFSTLQFHGGPEMQAAGAGGECPVATRSVSPPGTCLALRGFFTAPCAGAQCGRPAPPPPCHIHAVAPLELGGCPHPRHAHPCARPPSTLDRPAAPPPRRPSSARLPGARRAPRHSARAPSACRGWGGAFAVHT